MNQIFSSPAYTVIEHIPAETRENVVIVALANRMLEDGPHRPFAHRILAPVGFAASMGAFGLVNYADLLGLDAALAVSPSRSCPGVFPRARVG
ncbi:hypothetical protein [Stappia sp. WLB 29]|uniref:hypothetical protein n=1 Tax=Stappia sp. WLB 29 TaxID=2925220 RepID=UPI0020C0F7EE|nr:hypothetical protein [Stappia sp. WLB 29]